MSEGLTESLVTVKPRNSTVFSPNGNFFLLKTIPAAALRDKSLHVSVKFSARVLL